MRHLSIFALLVSAASLSSAATISSSCTVGAGPATVGTYVNGAGTVGFTCAGFTAPSLNQITSISLTGYADYSFGTSLPTNTFQVQYTAPAGFSPLQFTASATGTGASVPVTSSSSISAASVVPGVPLLSFASFNVTGVGSTTVGSVGSGNGSLTIAYTYEAQTPEPSTLALVGGVLVLAGIRKFRR